MTRRWQLQISALAGAVAVLCSIAAAAPRRPTGPDSFLRYRVQTVEELVAQVQADPVIRARLAKHFHVSQAELIRVLREELIVHTVPVSGYYTVYGVTEKAGKIYPTRQYFRKGQKIFSLRDGSPLLKYECGNPVTKTLPERPPKPVAPPPPPPLPPPSPPSAVGPGPVGEVPVAGALDSKLPEPGVTPMASLPPSPPEERVAPRERREVLPILVGAAAIPILLGGWDHDSCPPPVIPEPATIALIAFGLVAVVVLVWRERRAALARQRIR